MSGFLSKLADPGLEVDGTSESRRLIFLDYVGASSAFAGAAQAVVIGQVVSGQAFVSADRTYVYSTYAISVQSVLKQDAAVHLSTEGLVKGTVSGGTITFPSGHITHFVINREGFPGTGGTYVFSLWRPDDALEPDYQIVTAYQLENGLVYPLADGAPYSVYDEMPEGEFLEKLKAALSKEVKQ